MLKVDVAVIGGGPAGAVFVSRLLKASPSLKVMLVDGQQQNNKKVCGGLLAPDAQQVLARLGLTLPTRVLSDPQIFDVETIDLNTGIVRNYQRHYLNMDRFLFDKWLISLVPESAYIFNGRCVAVKRADNGFILELIGNNGNETVYTKRLVGADGASSVVRNTFFKKPKVRYVAIQQHFAVASPLLPPYSCIFDPQTSDSCSWTVQKNGTLIYGGAFSPQNCRKSFEQQKQRLEKFLGITLGTPQRTEACMLTSPRRLSDFCLGGKDVFLIGEAAGFISASSFEGISNAILSGEMLAGAFTKKDVLKAYKKSTLALRIRLCTKMLKRAVLCSPFLRRLIMLSGIQSIKKYDVHPIKR